MPVRLSVAVRQGWVPQDGKTLNKEYILAKVRIMSKITSKLQVTLPKALADRLRLRPGDEIDWQEAGDALRILPHRSQPTRFSSEMQLRLFDEATQRQRRRQARRRPGKETRRRGWTREELYWRGRAD
jgi:AbrB family looped-hinge helix DNA binding protein